MRTIPFGKPIIGLEERQAVAEVLDGHVFVHGPRVKQFEADFAKFTGAPHALSLSSCTAGLHLAWFDRGLGPGDEVIVPAQTHVATAHAVEYTGARPVFVDCDPETGNIDLDGVAAAVTERTRGICVVHFLGLPVDMDRINAIAAKSGLFVLEDCALAIGTRFKGVHAGLLGDAGAFSFYPVKHMTTAEGGMLITRQGDLAARINKKRAFGVDRVVGERTQPGIYDVTALGFNYRMNELEAALGIEQLKRVPGFLEARAANFRALKQALADINELRVLNTGTAGQLESSHYCLSAVLQGPLLEKRFELVNELKAQGIGTSVYYPRPVPQMTYYKEKYGLQDGLYANASAISHGSIAFPVGPHLTTEDIPYIALTLKTAIKKVLP